MECAKHGWTCMFLFSTSLIMRFAEETSIIPALRFSDIRSELTSSRRNVCTTSACRCYDDVFNFHFETLKIVKSNKEDFSFPFVYLEIIYHYVTPLRNVDN